MLELPQGGICPKEHTSQRRLKELKNTVSDQEWQPIMVAMFLKEEDLSAGKEFLFNNF